VSDGIAIILAAGPIDFRHLPVGTNLSNAMIPVNGRPVIGWILEDLIRKEVRSVTVVVRREDRRLIDFLRWAYAARVALAVAEVEAGGSILDSMAAGLAISTTDGPLRLILGDTLIQDSFEGAHDFVYVASVEGTHRWCLAVTDESDRVINYIDKAAGEDASGRALAGYYHLLDRPAVEAALRSTRESGGRELSAFLRCYGRDRTVTARRAVEWFDFGHIDNLVEARRKLLSPRSFNALSIDPVLHTLTKVSEHTEKLDDELAWYLELPERLKVLAPRIISHERPHGRLEIVQEYYGYPSLAELYVFGEMPPDFWASVMRRLFAILQEFRRHAGALDPSRVEDMYFGKTFDRLERLREDPWWNRLLRRETIRFNGRELTLPFAMRQYLRGECQRLAATSEISVIHGDFCFSNILFDINSQVVRLIDPRGRFGVRGIYGDRRYDAAKLRHSIAGMYDYLVADLFSLEGDEADFQGQVLSNGDHEPTVRLFDRLAVAAGFNPRDITLVEGLLFLSMIPLHGQYPKRQRMMFLTGLQILDACATSRPASDAAERTH